jgi:hypothetical protein
MTTKKKAKTSRNIRGKVGQRPDPMDHDTVMWPWKKPMTSPRGRHSQEGRARAY